MARHLYPLAVRGTTGPMAHGPRHRAADGGRLAHQVTSLGQAERLAWVCDNLNTHLCLLVPGLSARRGAAPGPARPAGVYAPARPLAPQGRTGTERPDAAGPVPAQGDAGRGSRAGHRMGGGPQRGPKGQTGRSAPPTPACASNICTLQWKHDGVLDRQQAGDARLAGRESGCMSRAENGRGRLPRATRGLPRRP